MRRQPTVRVMTRLCEPRNVAFPAKTSWYCTFCPLRVPGVTTTVTFPLMSVVFVYADVWPLLSQPVRATFWFGATVVLVAFIGRLVDCSNLRVDSCPWFNADALWP